MTHTHMDSDFASRLHAGVQSLADGWWLVLLRGIAAIVFGILAFVWPGVTLLTLTFLWGAYAIVDGVVSLWAAITGQTARATPRWWLGIIGVIGIIAGILAFAWPGVVVQALLIYIGVWAIVVGAMEIWGAIWLRREIEGEWLLALTGVLSILFGLAILFQPAAGALGLVWLIGGFAIVIGISHIALAMRLRGWHELATPAR
ncbi:MAG TPA: HdeD family acid-resistance protein [Devosiaceae bacterium]|jgi:uncharacterized membrane protein HdeD (DUF308 family)|nr:HdeD family acid-resistance protein [Devosiaceae bacterium]